MVYSEKWKQGFAQNTSGKLKISHQYPTVIIIVGL